ncbi:cytochrome c [Burkholderia sp. 4701]|nr:cytochrome c [Burkholderia sp. 4701]MXN85383.1 cytochrome c [Burkholderia sp. 4812]
MNAKASRIAAFWAGPVVIGAIVAAIGSHTLPESVDHQASRQAAIVPPVRFKATNVSLPSGNASFPPGTGSEIANAQCVMCHSPGMVLRQPALTETEWKATIMKMRSAFGAPIALDQVDDLARYLHTINGRESKSGESSVEGGVS